MTRDLPLALSISLPLEYEEILRERIATAEARGEIGVRTTIIHGALWEMRNRGKTRAEIRQELNDAIQEGVDSLNRGEGIRVTPAFWRRMRARVERDVARIKEAQAKGLLGNVLLPKELYEFVTDAIASGRFTSPTEVVCQALRLSQRKSPTGPA